MDTSFISDFVRFCNLEQNAELFVLEPFMEDQSPVGEYFIYQMNIYQPRWASYNLQKLKEICEHDGGYVADKNGNVLFFTTKS